MFFLEPDLKKAHTTTHDDFLYASSNIPNEFTKLIYGKASRSDEDPKMRKVLHMSKKLITLFTRIFQFKIHGKVHAGGNPQPVMNVVNHDSD